MSATAVMKFGGTSVGSTERIGAVANRVAEYVRATGERVVVVVSAMSGETDRLIELARKISPEKSPGHEFDQLLASGEQVSSALTALALRREGIPAKALLAPNVGLRTRTINGQHFISEITGERVEQLLDEGIVPIVAGFQGIDEEGYLTTLGRGGSDTTAVALAARLKANYCYILTDVDGVYTSLPSICKRAKRLEKLTYEEMLEMASSGAKVLQARSMHLAYKWKVPVIVASSFSAEPLRADVGTTIVEEYQGMEDAVVSGISHTTDQARLAVQHMPDKPGALAKLLACIGEAGIVVDMIVMSGGLRGQADVGLTVPEADAERAQRVVTEYLSKEMPEAMVTLDPDIAKLSVVGEGMRTHVGVAAEMFDVLGREGINIEMITTSEIKVSVAIKQKYSELAVRTLHEHFVENRS